MSAIDPMNITPHRRLVEVVRAVGDATGWLRARVESVPAKVDDEGTEWLNRALVLEAIGDPDSKFLAAAREHARAEVRGAVFTVLDDAEVLNMSGPWDEEAERIEFVTVAAVRAAMNRETRP